MTILALDERLGGSGVGSVPLAPVLRSIHRTHDITGCAVGRLLILHWTVGILTLDPVVSRREVRTTDGLVTQRPDDHTRVVVVHLDVMLVALKNLLGEERCIGDGLLGIVAEPMTLLVCLRTEIDTILVAEVVPHRIIGVMTGAHGIDIEPFHQLDILDHPFTAHHITAIRIHLMTVNTLDEYRLTVHQQLRIFDLHLAEAHLLTNGFVLSTDLRIFLRWQQSCNQRI